MTTIKKAVALALITLGSVPFFWIFNEDGVILNLMGIAYILIIGKYGKRIAPKIVRDYLNI